jgi:signal transduction histidine kinase
MILLKVITWAWEFIKYPLNFAEHLKLLKEVNEKLDSPARYNQELQLISKLYEVKIQNLIEEKDKLSKTGDVNNKNKINDLINKLNFESESFKKLIEHNEKISLEIEILRTVLSDNSKKLNFGGSPGPNQILSNIPFTKVIIFELIDLDNVIKTSLRELQYVLNLNKIGIKLDYDKNLPKITANFEGLQLVFTNLINNACYAIKQRRKELDEKGSDGVINISVHRDSNKLKIIVADNGIGIKREDFSKLFNPFFTTKTTKDRPEDELGTGLGLFIVKKIIENKHKGKISANSDYKEGTSFTIELPIK